MRGRESPLLLQTMIKEKYIRKLAEHELKGSDNYVVEVTVKSDNRIRIFIDSDHEINVDVCIALSRKIEGSLDREEEDFELMVSSAGLDQPFVMLRQYQKYLNRQVNVALLDGSKLTGILTHADDDSISVKTLITKSKHKTPEEGPEQRLPLNEIKETKPAVVFKK